MPNITFADLAAIAIDVDSLPPMRGNDRGNARKGDRKRTEAAKHETRARRQAREVKYAETVGAV